MRLIQGLFAVLILFFASNTYGQGMVPSLAGYSGGMRSGGSSSIPYAGRYGEFMPARMSGGGVDLGFQPRASQPMDSVRSSFSLPSMTGGMGLGKGPTMGSMGRGGMSTQRGMGVMTPSIGYPFRQPPVLIPSGPTVGMGMSM